MSFKSKFTFQYFYRNTADCNIICHMCRSCTTHFYRKNNARFLFSIFSSIIWYDSNLLNYDLIFTFSNLRSHFLSTRVILSARHPFLFCRYASYNNTVDATAAFSDSTLPSIGMLILLSAHAAVSFRSPLPSFPIRKADAPR